MYKLCQIYTIYVNIIKRKVVLKTLNIGLPVSFLLIDSAFIEDAYVI